MPSQLWNFFFLFAVIIVVFILLRRPLYEAMAIAFVALLCITGSWSNALVYLEKAAKSSILYTIALFLIFSSILKRTGVIQECIDIIIALVGRLPGGAGIISIVSSAFMGALSGSGPGNVAATGSITIPLMERAGYSPEFSAGIAMAGSCLGPIIPPSATILSSFTCLFVMSGFEDYTLNRFWTVMYGVAIVFIIHRIVQFYLMYAFTGQKNRSSGELPVLSQVWRQGWPSFLVILIIMLPFALDNTLGEQIASVLGATSAKHFSSCILFFTPAVALVYSLIIGRRHQKLRLRDIAAAVGADVKNISAMIGTLFLAYAISELLGDCDIISATESFLMSLHLSKFAMVLILMLMITLVGMFMPGTSMIPLLGPVYVLILSSYGVNPVIIAAMLPVLFVSLGQMTPPFAICMLAAMGIAKSEFKSTAIQATLWSLGQFAVALLILMGIVPVPFS